MRIYFLGIAGSLMGSLAQLAKQLGHEALGSDKALHPPMSDLLAAHDISAYAGFEPAQLKPAPDLVVIGNAGLPRGDPALEHVLNSGLPYVSGAEWLGRTVLRGRWVLAVSGTHGKTTTSSMLAWILDQAGREPGFMIGGAPLNFDQSARLGAAPLFVVEADEYDTSYFDRRSKFLHYRPRTLIVNNLEYDHADIFPNIEAIRAQFHLLLRSVPGNGQIIAPSQNSEVNQLLLDGCWTPVVRFGDRARSGPVDMDTGECWSAGRLEADGSAFDLMHNDDNLGRVNWSLIGAHNVQNGLAAVAAAHHAGVPPQEAMAALQSFAGIKRRLEVIAQIGETWVYDDFAHHPTSIRTTLQALRRKVGDEEVIAIVEPRTHTMSLGNLREQLATCCAPADQALWFRSADIRWDLNELIVNSNVPARQFSQMDRLIDYVCTLPARRRHLVIMSNGHFENIHQRLSDALTAD